MKLPTEGFLCEETASGPEKGRDEQDYARSRLASAWPPKAPVLVREDSPPSDQSGYNHGRSAREVLSMREALVDGRLVLAGVDSPEEAVCPSCGGTVKKRKRR